MSQIGLHPGRIAKKIDYWKNSRIASLRRVHGRGHGQVDTPENEGRRQRVEAFTKAGVLASGPTHKVDHGFDIRV